MLHYLPYLLNHSYTDHFYQRLKERKFSQTLTSSMIKSVELLINDLVIDRRQPSFFSDPELDLLIKNYNKIQSKKLKDDLFILNERIRVNKKG